LHHGSGSHPRLAGQHAAYMAGQLWLWKAGHVHATTSAALMAPIAQRLSDAQIDAVSAYFAATGRDAQEALLP
jgi:cytochrome c553